jgi:hypothetical protein
MAEALKSNSTLTLLDLANNRINSEGCVALGKALEINSGIEIIRLYIILLEVLTVQGWALTQWVVME